jgi:hypothetical protein
MTVWVWMALAGWAYVEARRVRARKRVRAPKPRRARQSPPAVVAGARRLRVLRRARANVSIVALSQRPPGPRTRNNN